MTPSHHRQTKLSQLLLGEFSFKRIIRSVLFIYLVLGVYLFFFTDQLIFISRPSSYVDHEEILKISTADQNQVSAQYFPFPNAEYTILYAHGNAEDLGEIQFRLQQFHQQGFSVFAYDYPGYGTSTGKPTEKTVYFAIDAVYRYLIEQLKIPPEKIIVYGRSVGGGSALELATHQSVAGVVLESTFTTPFRVVIPFPIFPFEPFDNVQKIKKIKAPVLILHGKQDQVIPFAHSQRLFEIAPEPKFYFWVETADHNNLVEVAGDAYWQQLKQFIQLIN